MRWTPARVVIVGVVLASIVATAIYYPFAPERVASHWNAAGVVNGYMSRFWGLSIFPLIEIGLAVLLLAIPEIDPLKANIATFRTHYDRFIAVFLTYMLLIQLVVIAWNAGWEIQFNVIIPLAVGALMFYIGTMLGHVKRNYFIGVRTPWTLNSDVVWEKTHRLAAKLFMASGLITVLGVPFGRWMWLFVVVPIGVTTVWAIAYSYLEWRKIEKDEARRKPA